MRKNAVRNYPFDLWFLSERERTLANDRLSDSHSDQQPEEALPKSVAICAHCQLWQFNQN